MEWLSPFSQATQNCGVTSGVRRLGLALADAGFPELPTPGQALYCQRPPIPKKPRRSHPVHSGAPGGRAGFRLRSSDFFL
jgi:hypothetical protein